jgi:hypothetical protein
MNGKLRSGEGGHEVRCPPSIITNLEKLIRRRAMTISLMIRLGTTIIIWWGITVISFLVGRCPESEIDKIMSTISYVGSEAETRASIRHAMGTDQPIHLHYLRWLGIWPQENGQFQGVMEGYLGDEAWR